MMAQEQGEIPDYLRGDDNEQATAAQPSQTGGLAALVQEQLDMKAQIELLEEDLKGIKQRYDDLRKRRLPEAMRNAGLVGPDGRGNFTHKTGAKVHLRGEVYAHVPADAQADFFGWLRANGLGDLIKETVHPSTLKSFAKERLENDQPLPPMLTSHLETVAVVTQPKRGEL